ISDEVIQDQGIHHTSNTSKLTMSVSEAAEWLGISRAFAYELVARGELPSIRLGRRVLVPTKRLFDFVLEARS
ncbi:MAG TPA: helix-turn-helix domain-containing protein, partial [Acidimicrobiales bacterium]|nr:helix-turn-helix domain-containing protein [Acidimicrobiales bacterium]